MSMLKKMLLALGIILVIAAVGVYFLPNQYNVSNSIEINKPVDVVYAQLNDFNRWHAWSPWAEKEPTAQTTIEGTPGAKGHKMSWDGKQLGAGSMTLSWADMNKTIHSDLEFLKPFKAKAKDQWDFEAVGDKTKVTWTNSGGLAYPMGRLFGISVSKMMNEEQRHGLDNLKKYCESMPAPVASNDSTSTADKPM
jgi:hypothetical protein